MVVASLLAQLLCLICGIQGSLLVQKGLSFTSSSINSTLQDSNALASAIFQQASNSTTPLIASLNSSFDRISTFLETPPYDSNLNNAVNSTVQYINTLSQLKESFMNQLDNSVQLQILNVSTLATQLAYKLKNISSQLNTINSPQLSNTNDGSTYTLKSGLPSFNLISVVPSDILSIQNLSSTFNDIRGTNYTFLAQYMYAMYVNALSERKTVASGAAADLQRKTLTFLNFNQSISNSKTLSRVSNNITRFTGSLSNMSLLSTLQSTYSSSVMIALLVFFSVSFLVLVVLVVLVWKKLRLASVGLIIASSLLWCAPFLASLVLLVLATFAGDGCYTIFYSPIPFQSLQYVLPMFQVSVDQAAGIISAASNCSAGRSLTNFDVFAPGIGDVGLSAFSAMNWNNMTRFYYPNAR